jgi:K+-sensing histidine kinase KdpD
MEKDDRETESLVYASIGPIAAIALGIALIPLRGLTPASNFAFAFISLTIVVAEFGGRWAALATAICSAVSLNFFLTEPYLRLTIHSVHDVVAFAGLAVCGLIAAALGAHRAGRVASARAVRRQLDLLQEAVRELDPATALEAQLTRVLRSAREVFSLAAAVVRDEHGEVLASCAPLDAQRPAPASRIDLEAGGRAVGSLDVWEGGGAPMSAEARRTLTAIARLMALVLAGFRPGPAGGADGVRQAQAAPRQ